MKELKTCPFCGATAFISSYRTMDNGRWIRKYYAGCMGCGVTMPASLSFEDRKKAVEAWNRRVAVRQESEISRQLKECWAKAQAYMRKGDPILSNKEYAKVVALRWVLGYCDTTDIKWDIERDA